MPCRVFKKRIRPTLGYKLRMEGAQPRALGYRLRGSAGRVGGTCSLPSLSALLPMLLLPEGATGEITHSPTGKDNEVAAHKGVGREN